MNFKSNNQKNIAIIEKLYFKLNKLKVTVAAHLQLIWLFFFAENLKCFQVLNVLIMT